MRLRSRRWRVTASDAPGRAVVGYGGRFARRPRHGRIRRWIHTGALLTVMGLMRVARWWPVFAGVVLTAVGIVLRDGAGGVVLLPGLILLLSAPLVPPSPKAERMRRAMLEREMAAYSTPAQRRDFEAILNRYPDRDTCELRDVLARQAASTHAHGIPGSGLPGGGHL